MTVAEYIVNELIKSGTTHAFGIPGGVILKLLAAMQKVEPTFTPHLCYHEQTAGFAALGYAQASGKTGAAYATRGPGIANMVTCIAEAYQESLPVIFITAHGQRKKNTPLRFNSDQELDIVSSVSSFTKFSANADSPEEAVSLFKKALCIAQSGRKGPVLIDFSAGVFDKEVRVIPCECGFAESDNGIGEKAVLKAAEMLSHAKRPLLLIGDGLRFDISKQSLAEITAKLGIPVLSSRGAQDLLGGTPHYFGYVGSHGVRYSNFILSKTDLIIAVGNRMAFPLNSISFSPIIKNARILRIDIEQTEPERQIPAEISFVCGGGDFLRKLCDKYAFGSNGWLDICRRIKNELMDEDCTETVLKLSSFICRQPKGKYYVCDVGNNEFWFSRAYERSGCGDGIRCSKSFGSLGSAIGCAIGAYYATGGCVICVCGDQGFQYNIQELRYISQWNLPIKVILLNNNCSGMIKDHERAIQDNMLIHVDVDSGYSTPDFGKIADGYEITFTAAENDACEITDRPVIYEIKTDVYEPLRPCLPKGNSCQDMYPTLDREKYEYLDKL